MVNKSENNFNGCMTRLLGDIPQQPVCFNEPAQSSGWVWRRGGSDGQGVSVCSGMCPGCDGRDRLRLIKHPPPPPRRQTPEVKTTATTRASPSSSSHINPRQAAHAKGHDATAGTSPGLFLAF